MKAFAMVRLSFPTIKCHAKKKKNHKVVSKM